MDIKSLLGLLILLITIYCSDSDHEVEIKYPSCYFYYWMNGSQFKFTSCKYRVCLSYNQKSRSCWKQQIKQKQTLLQCTNECCQPKVVYNQSYQTIKQCQYYNKFSYEGYSYSTQDQYSNDDSLISSPGFIVFLVVFSLYGFISMSCLIHAHCVDKCSREIREQNAHENRNDPPLSITNLQIYEPVQWKQQIPADKKQFEHNCIICLDNKPNVKLECNHIYHLHCIVGWVAKTWNCSLCRSKDINNIKIYCRKCFNLYHQSRLRADLKQVQQNMVCHNCKVNQE